MDLLPREFKHLSPVGRLDKDAKGLTLMTNDASLINQLTHLRFNVEKTCAAVLDGGLYEGDRVKEASLMLGALPEGKWRFLEKGELKKICVSVFIALCCFSPVFAEGGGVMKLTSPEFENKEFIPRRFTCQGENVSPALNVESIPPGVKSLALIVDDPDAPMGTWLHWLVFDIPVVSGIGEGGIPGKQGINDFGRLNYGGPCPPSGTHRYFFKIYALDTMLDLQEGADRKALEAAMKGHILDSAELIGLYKKQ